VIYLPIIDDLYPKPEYLPVSIPKQLSLLTTLHGAPGAWFIGHLVKYIMRPSLDMISFIDKAKLKMKFRKPIVGVHVRRTDKVDTEASFHALSEYMRYVEIYYQNLKIKFNRQKKVNKLNHFQVVLLVLISCLNLTEF